MENIQNFQCKNCTYPLDITKAENGILRCPQCGSTFTLPKPETAPEVVISLNQGEVCLNACDFNGAYAAFFRAAEQDGSEPEAYWGMALSEFKVQYLRDTVKNCLQPICHEISEKRICENKNFCRALELSSGVQKEEYLRKGKEIDYIREQFFALREKNLFYDVFICVKVSNNDGGFTNDYNTANKIYDDLKDRGYKPFFSERELKEVTGADYEARILYALYVAECMLIVCSDEEYLYTRWVKNEWARFLEMIANKEKETDSVTFVFSGAPIEKLPGKTGKIQGIDFKNYDAFTKIERFVYSHTPESRKKKEEEAARKQREIEELDSIKQTVANLSTAGTATVASLLVRGNQHLSYAEYSDAYKYFNMVLEANPQNAEAWWGLFLCNFNVVHEDRLLSNLSLEMLKKISENTNFCRALEYSPSSERFVKFKRATCEFALKYAEKRKNERLSGEEEIKDLNSQAGEINQNISLCDKKEKEITSSRDNLGQRPRAEINEALSDDKFGYILIACLIIGIVTIIFYLISAWSPLKTPWEFVWKVITYLIPECGFKNAVIYDVIRPKGFLNGIIAIIIGAIFGIAVAIISAIITFSLRFGLIIFIIKPINKKRKKEIETYDDRFNSLSEQIAKIEIRKQELDNALNALNGKIHNLEKENENKKTIERYCADFSLKYGC